MKLNEIQVTSHEINLDQLSSLIDFVVDNSYDADGRYHKYLMDYSEAIAIISFFTDYDNTNYDGSEVMNLIWSEKWDEIKQNLGYLYTCFHSYVLNEIKYKNTPLRNADQTLNTVMEFARKVNEILGKIDYDALSNYDFTKLTEAIDAYNESKDIKEKK